jgi:hypothetical protein
MVIGSCGSVHAATAAFNDGSPREPGSRTRRHFRHSDEDINDWEEIRFPRSFFARNRVTYATECHWLLGKVLAQINTPQSTATNPTSERERSSAPRISAFPAPVDHYSVNLSSLCACSLLLHCFAPSPCCSNSCDPRRCFPEERCI